VVLPAKVEKQRRFSIKKKAPKPPPESIAIDYQSTSALSTTSNWKTVFTFEMLLPKTGVAEGPSFAVPLDNHRYRAVISARRTGTGSGMVEKEGAHEFTVNPSGTKEARVRNYPITWEQVDNARRNQSLRSTYNIPEFVFHGRLINTPPYPRLLRVNGDIIDYFLPDQAQCIEDERYRTLEGYKENPAEFIKTVNDNVNYKAFAIVEVRRVIYEHNRNGNYVSAELAHAIAYDEEYTNAKVKSPGDCTVGVRYVYDYGPQEATRRIDRKDAHRFAVDPALALKSNADVPAPNQMPASPQQSTYTRLRPTQFRTFGATSSPSYGLYSDGESDDEWNENPDPFGGIEGRSSDFGGFEEQGRADTSRALVLQQRADELKNFEESEKIIFGQFRLFETLYATYKDRLSIDDDAKIKLDDIVSNVKDSRRNADNAINAFRVSPTTETEDVRQRLIAFENNVVLFIRTLSHTFNATLDTKLSLLRFNTRRSSLSDADKDEIVALIGATQLELSTLGENIFTTTSTEATRTYENALNVLDATTAKLAASSAAATFGSGASSSADDARLGEFKDSARALVAKFFGWRDNNEIVKDTITDGRTKYATAYGHIDAFNELYEEIRTTTTPDEAGELYKRMSQEAMYALVETIKRRLELPGYTQRMSDENKLDAQQELRNYAINAETGADPVSIETIESVIPRMRALNYGTTSIQPPSSVGSSIVDDFYANLYNDSAPIGDDIIEEAEEVVSNVAKTTADAVTDVVAFTVLPADALVHSFNSIMHAAVSTMSPRYFPEIFEPGKNYITIIPDLSVWNRIASDIHLGKVQTQAFVRSHTFAVPSDLFSHSRQFILTSVGKPSKTIGVKRTYDKNERATIIRVKSINGARVKFSGILDTHMTTPSLVQSVKLSGWRDF